MRSRVFVLVALLFSLVTAASRATTIVLPTDEQLIRKSPLIVSGRVISSLSVEREGGIWTETLVSVEEVLKGRAGSEVVIREVGGRIGERVSVVFGSPDYTPGEHVLVFLRPTRRGDYQTTDLFVGKFSDQRTREGIRLWYQPNDLPGTELLDRDFQPVPAARVQRDAGRFTQYITDRASGLEGDRNYGVRDAVLARNSFESNFTLIDEPNIYRWFAFEQGQQASWLSSGSQPGYTNGGVNEASAAMAAWNSAASANIRYVYGGVSSAPPGGLAASNGINEVLFNDPLGEITGGYNASTGGIVGRGGFTNVRSGGAWTSPFTADPAHPATNYPSTGNILEGNLVIASGVSPQAGISSGVLAAILTHEFGHTLGFGHSADPGAIMYSSVRSSSAAIFADDQNLARWLYPSGTGATPPPPPPAPSVPAAPSNLTAAVINGNQALLNWTLSATSATAQTVYVAPSGAGFINVGDVDPSARSLVLSGFTAGQSYQIRLTAKNQAGESAPSNTASVTIPAAPVAVQAAFSVSTASGLANTTQFNFSDQSSGPVSSRQWNFGDGASSTAVNPSKVYPTAGTYTVTLTVSSGSSQSQSSASRQIVVSAQPAPAPVVTAAFNFSVGGQTVSFQDKSSNAVSWSWNFGDGTGSSLRNPVKIYSAAGSYQVTLRITNGASSSSTTRTVTISRRRGRAAGRR